MNKTIKLLTVALALTTATQSFSMWNRLRCAASSARAYVAPRISTMRAALPTWTNRLNLGRSAVAVRPAFAKTAALRTAAGLGAATTYANIATPARAEGLQNDNEFKPRLSNDQYSLCNYILKVVAHNFNSGEKHKGKVYELATGCKYTIVEIERGQVVIDMTVTFNKQTLSDPIIARIASDLGYEKNCGFFSCAPFLRNRYPIRVFFQSIAGDSSAGDLFVSLRILN